MYAYITKPLNFPWPPVIYALAIVAAMLLGRFATLQLVDIGGYAFWVIGGLLVALAVTLDIWALKTLWQFHTTAMPHRCASRLVTTGPFRYSRNPIYLGYTLLTVALGLFTGNGWFLAAAPVAAIVTTLFAIRCEEMHLLARFGIDFERYCARTRRWI